MVRSKLTQQDCSLGGALALLHEEVGAITNAVTALGADWDSFVRRLERHVTQGQYEKAWTALQEFLIRKAPIDWCTDTSASR
jgi:hypothetical protein